MSLVDSRSTPPWVSEPLAVLDVPLASLFVAAVPLPLTNAASFRAFAMSTAAVRLRYASSYFPPCRCAPATALRAQAYLWTTQVSDTDAAARDVRRACPARTPDFAVSMSQPRQPLIHAACSQRRHLRQAVAWRCPSGTGRLTTSRPATPQPCACVPAVGTVSIRPSLLQHRANRRRV